MNRNRKGAVVLLLLLAVRLHAHVVSMSTGELHMDGPTAVFDLRVPVYEVAQVAHPETELLTHFRFGDGHLTRSFCHEDDGAYVCHGEYEFPNLHPNALDVECTLYQAIVPNHVHLLTATQGTNTDQEVFDRRFTEIGVRFRPSSRVEAIAREMVSGAWRALQSVSGWLALVALALAARSRTEALLFCDAFLSLEFLARYIGPLLPLTLSTRFLEALAGLVVSYLAIEILLLPNGRARWVIAALLGLCQGLFLAGFPGAYLLGALPVQGVFFAILAVAALKTPMLWQRRAGVLLLAGGIAWFGTGFF